MVTVNVLALTSTIIFSSSSSQWIEDWWENVYQQRIVPEQNEILQQKELSRCQKKILFYRQKVQESLNSKYYKFKLDSWTERCNDQQLELKND